jgi:hypothetical protein
VFKDDVKEDKLSVNSLDEYLRFWSYYRKPFSV